MSIWSRIADLTQLLHGPKKPPEKSIAFTIAMIALGAKMAKADGVVTDDEVKAFFEVFHVPEKDVATVKRIYNQAKEDIAGYETYATQVARLFGAKSHVLESVLDGLFHIAKADGVIHPGEMKYLESIAAVFGFKDADWMRIRARHVTVKDDPFEILGLAADAKPGEIKKRYKELAKELHPDKQIAAGVPEEMVRLATERLARINSAYAQIERMGAL